MNSKLKLYLYLLIFCSSIFAENAVNSSEPAISINSYNDPQHDAALKKVLSKYTATNIIIPKESQVINKKKIKRQAKLKVKQNSPQTLANMRFDFTFHDDVNNLPDALKNFDPTLHLLLPLGKKQALQFNTDLSNTSVNEIAVGLNMQTDGKVSLIYDSIDDSVRLVFSNKLTNDDIATDVIQEAKKWQNGSQPKPVITGDGVIQFPFGAYPPLVICKPLKICDIRLEAGELIRGWALSDKEMWILPGASSPQILYSGQDGNTTPHILLKPVGVGLDSNLIITTNKRTYNIELQSSRDNYVTAIGFYYPDEINQSIIDKRDQIRLQNQSQTILPLSGAVANSNSADNITTPPEQSMVPVSNLNWNYKVTGDTVDWKPTQVFDDGTHVWIKFPSTAQIAPPLFGLDDSGKQKSLLVYEIEPNGYYRVDSLFNMAALIVGDDNSQQKVLITKIDPNRPWYKKIFGG